MTVRTQNLKEIREFYERAEHAPIVLLSEEEARSLLEARVMKDEMGVNWYRDVDLIADDSFDEFCEEMAYDIGDVQRGGVAAGLIDWGKYAERVCFDYKAVIYMDEKWWYRA